MSKQTHYRKKNMSQPNVYDSVQNIINNLEMLETFSDDLQWELIDQAISKLRSVQADFVS